VPYDEALAERVRVLFAGEPSVVEKRMFGGLAFLLGGHMAVCASSDGGLLVRVDPGASEELTATTAAELMEMQGRPTRGWLRVPAEAVRREPDLGRWVGIGTDFARSLPPKR
jgi:TfoX/Sxy family transcriptional regulator of competence genes